MNDIPNNGRAPLTHWVRGYSLPGFSLVDHESHDFKRIPISQSPEDRILPYDTMPVDKWMYLNRLIFNVFQQE